MEAITSAGDGGCCISNLEWTSHSRPYFGLMFYHFLLPLFCPCVSICGQLQEPPDLFIEIDTPYAELSCQQPFLHLVVKSFSFPCSCYVFFFQHPSLLQTCAHGLNIQGCACWGAVQSLAPRIAVHCRASSMILELQAALSALEKALEKAESSIS